MVLVTFDALISATLAFVFIAVIWYSVRGWLKGGEYDA